jgi:hypothetical protein
MSLANSLLVGLWIPVEGNAKETIEYRDDHTVRMALFGGMVHLTGRYQFLDKDTVQIDWDNQPSPDANAVLDRLNQGTAQGQTAPVRLVQRTVLQITVTNTELNTLHVEKGRRGHFRRASIGAGPVPSSFP